jgi:DNA polymerase-3 subunit epsilon
MHNKGLSPMSQQLADRNAARQWARNILATPRLLILDTETTGLDSQAEIVQLAIIALDGSAVMNTLVQPTRPIPADASRIHGITDAHIEMACAPPWDEILPVLRSLLYRREIVIYNAAYDLRLMRQSTKLRTGNDDDMPEFSSHCAMCWYSQWVGEWNKFHGNYRWQRLPAGDHSALGDCLATLKIIKQMAAE